MGPVALRVRVGGMKGVKDKEKNRAKVEKKLGVEERVCYLFMTMASLLLSMVAKPNMRRGASLY